MAEASKMMSTAASVVTIGGNAVLALGAGAVLAMSALYSPDALPQLTVCTFRTATGLPCPGCGLTRSFCAISHGAFAAAWEFNPFGFLLYGLAAGFLLRPLLLWAWPACRAWEQRVLDSRGFRAAPIILVVAMLVFGLCRMWCAVQ